MSKCEHDWYTFPSIKNKKVCIKCKVKEELPKPQWEVEFDKEFDAPFQQWTPLAVKAFIKDQITEAYNKGIYEGWKQSQERQKYVNDLAMSNVVGNHSPKGSDMPEKECDTSGKPCNCNPKIIKVKGK